MVSWFKTMTTNKYIKGVKNGLFISFNKHLWQRSFFDHIIRNEQDLFNVRQYIELNPIKWELDDEFI